MLLTSAGLVAATAAAGVAATGGEAIAAPTTQRPGTGRVKAKDNAEIFYKDWGNGQAIVFSHGWPLSADAWDFQMAFFSQNGFRTFAHDRRSHGQSDQTFDGNNMAQYADDLAVVINALPGGEQQSSPW